jgi:hypothetical protein
MGPISSNYEGLSFLVTESEGLNRSAGAFRPKVAMRSAIFRVIFDGVNDVSVLVPTVIPWIILFKMPSPESY